MLETRKRKLEEIILNKEESLQAVPEGHLRIDENKGHRKYYLLGPGKGRNGKYIRKSEEDLIRRLAQKDYDKAIKKQAEKELALIDRLLNAMEKKIELLFGDFSKGYQTLITPIELPAEKFIEIWQKQTFQKNPYEFTTMEFCTERGELVRSKSEVLIANALYRNKIPYLYEKPLTLKNGIVKYPDFTCLNVETRTEYIWEHLGRMDDPSYAEHAVSKLLQYSQDGFYPGENLILTFETNRNPLGTRSIDATIQHFFK